MKANHGEGLEFGLRAKGLTFYENPFNMARIHAIKDVEGRKIEDAGLKG
jgi:hypothetical protein